MLTFSKGKKLALSCLACLLAVVFAAFIPKFRAPLVSFLRVPLLALTAVKNEIGGIIFYHRNMVDNRRLANETQLLRRKLVDADEAVAENARLRELLGLKKNVPYKVISCSVIGRNPSEWSSSLIINKGSAHGIKKGHVCVGFLGLIGRVVEVDAGASKVMLINDPNLCVSALVQRTRQEGLICGSLSGAMLMKYLSKDSDVRKGDTVITSGLTDIPKGIVIGVVSELRDELSGVTRYAVVRPAVELSAVEEILVIIP